MTARPEPRHKLPQLRSCWAAAMKIRLSTGRSSSQSSGWPGQALGLSVCRAVAALIAEFERGLREAAAR